MRNPHRSKKKDYFYTGRITQSMTGRFVQLINNVPLVFSNGAKIKNCTFKNIRSVIIRNRRIKINNSNFISKGLECYDYRLILKDGGSGEFINLHFKSRSDISKAPYKIYNIN